MLSNISNETLQAVSLVPPVLRKKPRTQERNDEHHLIIAIIISPDLYFANQTSHNLPEQITGNRHTVPCFPKEGICLTKLIMSV